MEIPAAGNGRVLKVAACINNRAQASSDAAGFVVCSSGLPRKTGGKMIPTNFIFRVLRFIPFLLLFQSCSSPDGVLSDTNEITKEDFERRKLDALNDYQGLFKNEFRTKMKLWDAQISPGKCPVLSFTYDGKINLIITKVVLQNSAAPLKEIVFTSGNATTGTTAGAVYRGYDLANTQFRLAAEGDSIVKTVFISYDRSVLQQNTNDSNFISHRLYASGFSARYEKDGIVDFCLNTTRTNIYEKKPNGLQINTLLYRREETMYIIVAYTDSKIETGNAFLEAAVFGK